MPRTEVSRVFLGWERPGLDSVVGHLAARRIRDRQWDLGGIVGVVPIGRARRRLLEMLVVEAQRREVLLVPPRLITPGQLFATLCRSAAKEADDLTRRLAWAAALQATDPQTLQAVVPTDAARIDDWDWRLDFAEVLDWLHIELAAGSLDFEQVARRGAKLSGFAEMPRWRALAAIAGHYERILHEQGLVDPQRARQEAVEQQAFVLPDELLLIAVAELNPQQRDLIARLPVRVAALVFAPETMAERFDALGCCQPEAWAEAEIPVPMEQVEIVETPDDQAFAAQRAIARLDGKFAAGDITVGVPDTDVIPLVELRFRETGLPARCAAGTDVTRTGPYRLLAAAADYLESRRVADFAALVRHPDLEPLLGGGRASEWIAALDDYCAEFLPETFDGSWLGTADDHTAVRRLYEAVRRRLTDFHRERSLADWAEPIRELLLQVYGRRTLDRQDEADRLVLEACEILGAALAALQGVPAALSPKVSPTQALRMVLRQVAGAAVSPRGDQEAIELLGWLELLLDDAPVLILTGMEEGTVPASVGADLFLPNRLRHHLGLDDNATRFARDAYVFSALLAVRRHVHLIAGRRNSDGDPILPSRLLLACGGEELSQRVLRFFREPVSARATGTLLVPGRAQTRFHQLHPPGDEVPVERMRVTAFRDYLQCPYRYYLRHVLRLSTADDTVEELSPLAFGILAHDVLQQFAQSGAATQTDAEKIARCLEELLHELARSRYGNRPLPAVQMQLEQLRHRLLAFARWQAERTGQGWQIVHSEVDVREPQAPFEVDGRPVYLAGRIDRIDIHQDTGQCVVLDYKTGDSAKAPKETHRLGGEWVDLQLPLYRHLVAPLGYDGAVELGYILLPKDLTRTGLAVAEWSREELHEADETARRVLRAIRSGVFWPPNDGIAEDWDEFASVCRAARLPEEGQA